MVVRSMAESAGPPDESGRAQAVFAARDRDRDTRERYSFFQRGYLHAIQERERHLLALLAAHGFDDERLARSDVLAVGCGAGGELLDLARWGGTPGRMFGVDLDGARTRRAKARNASFGIFRADGRRLPFPSSRFDLVTQFTLLTSVLDPHARRAIAGEMLRVARPGGSIVWYDFWPDNPNNAEVRGIRAAEIRSLFPGCRFDFQRITVAPPLARWLAPRAWLLADLVSRVRPLQTFHLVGIRRLPTPQENSPQVV
jgi:SAM-dependent methyltransferase